MRHARIESLIKPQWDAQKLGRTRELDIQYSCIHYSTLCLSPWTNQRWRWSRKTVDPIQNIQLDSSNETRELFIAGKKIWPRFTTIPCGTDDYPRFILLSEEKSFTTFQTSLWRKNLNVFNCFLDIWQIQSELLLTLFQTQLNNVPSFVS